jgi:hypothetical protein
MAAWRFRSKRVFPPCSDGAIILGRERPTRDTVSFSDKAHREHGLMVFIEKQKAKASSSEGRTWSVLGNHATRLKKTILAGKQLAIALAVLRLSHTSFP